MSELAFWTTLSIGAVFGWAIAKAEWRGLFTEDPEFADEWHDDDSW